MIKVDKAKLLKILMENKHPWWNKISKKRTDHKTLEKYMKKMMLQCKKDDPATDYAIIKGGDNNE